ncbi:RagB/SusD family nutrient uptake outer membrane protein [Pedobacter sp. GR22-6]|uniref:RagB/SusD family nutrient uptake outer membrane protein n=1 Tax=Pedobacter sp. GR22-6 TaxID=3127957 RepID=UPI00307FCB61
MKINIYRSVIFGLLCLAFSSCKKDFLVIVPEGQKVATSTEDYRLLMADPALALYNFAGGWQGQAIMGDDVAAESSMFGQAQLPTQAAFRWDNQIFRIEDKDWTTDNWLENLYQLNKVINEVQAAKGGDAQLKDEIEAAARASRAWVYFQLINLYGKPYLAGTAATDLGFPIILTSDITVEQFKRNTVQEVYEFIIKEFSSAIPKLPMNPATGIQFNKSAAEGMLGKVYLFMGRNADALSSFNAAFADNALRAVPAKLYDYVLEFGSGGKFTPINYDGPNNSPGNNYNDFTESLVSRRFYNSSYSGNGFGNDAFVLDPKAQALFGNADLRLKFYAPEFPWSTPNPSGRLRKYGVTYSAFGLQISELYLLRAEVKARTNDLSGAVADLEMLRKNRMPAADATVPSAIAGNQINLIKYVFEERIREFAMEGYRWFDMRRQSVDPIFAGQVHTHTLYNFEAGTNTVFTLRPERLTLRLPQYITDKNPGMPNNP